MFRTTQYAFVLCMHLSLLHFLDCGNQVEKIYIYNVNEGKYKSRAYRHRDSIMKYYSVTSFFRL